MPLYVKAVGVDPSTAAENIHRMHGQFRIPIRLERVTYPEKEVTMTMIVDRKNLATVKLALADKYETLARSAKSQVKQSTFSHKAKKYRKQATEMASE